jgi:hypothetical protein
MNSHKAPLAQTEKQDRELGTLIAADRYRTREMSRPSMPAVVLAILSILMRSFFYYPLPPPEKFGHR